MFALESTRVFNLGLKIDVKVYKHAHSHFRILFVDTPGPLCSATIVLPTQSNNDKGLPHTLEHLIFCGSKNMPLRGYLDNLATRSLSSGTNAYTTEDHTAYEITTAGAEGMMNVFPVFMDHVLNPTLTPSQYVTEVYHLDGSAKHQGVVYCEMASREQTEPDVMDLAIRRLLFPGTTYAYECGGLTGDIQRLSLDEIKAYHQKYYHLDNVTAVLCGKYDIDAFLSKCEFEASGKGAQEKMNFLPITEAHTSVQFPSSDIETGSIGYAWRGPELSDVKAHTVVDILVRVFAESSAAPLNQTFVEIESPLATDVGMYSRRTVTGAIMCVFYGVPFGNVNAAEDVDEAMSNGSMSEESESMSEESEEDEPEGDHPDYFAPGYFDGLLTTCLEKSVNDFTIERIHAVLKRYILKINEEIEDESHEAMMGYLLADIMANSYVEKTHYGTRADILELCEMLKSEDLSFWKEQANNWFIDNKRVEVMCMPNAEMAEENGVREETSLKQRQEAIGTEGLERLRECVDKAVHDNRIDIPQVVIDKMPALPDVSKLNYLKSTTEYEQFSGLPYSMLQRVSVNTSFSHIKIGLEIKHVPEHLLPYLVLFQALLFETPVVIRGLEMTHTEVVLKSQELMISHDACLGFGNDGFTTAWLSEMFIIQSTTERFSETAHWIVDVLENSVFRKERTYTVIKNLLGGLPESKRDGSGMCSAVLARISGLQIDRDISLFKQEDFLKGLMAEEWDVVLGCLVEVQNALLRGTNGFAQAGLKAGESAQPLIDAWRRSGAAVAIKSDVSPFPIPRCPYTLADVDVAFGKSVAVPISGLVTSFVNLTVPCNASDEEHAAVLVLGEIFSRIEGSIVEVFNHILGPLYTRIRGKGFAYGVSMHYGAWHGQLVFDCSEVSDPFKAVEAFWDVLEEYTFNEFDCSTAKAGVLYRLIEQQSNNGGVLQSALKSALKNGRESQAGKLEALVSQVGELELDSVLQKYFLQFLDPQIRLSTMTTVSGPSFDAVMDAFGGNVREERVIAFKSTTLKDLKL